MIEQTIPTSAVVLVVIGGLYTGLLLGYIVLASARRRSRGTRLDTPGKAIRREKERYADGEITLDKFESRVYQMIPVDDPVTEPVEVAD